MQISGSTILLTGASGGLGQAIARALHERGGELILTGRRAEVLEPLATELDGRALSVDLSDPAETERLAAQAGEVDIFVANAAVPASGELESYTQEQIDRSLDVNLRAPIVLAHSLLGGMTARGRGHLLFVSSIHGKAATQGASLYCASKFGMRGFAAGLRADMHATGVGVSTVFPGFIRGAGMWADAGVKLPPGVGTRTPEDVARAVVKAIERNLGEVDVAPLTVRASVIFTGFAPDLSARASRLLGSEEISREVAGAQRGKR